MKAYLKRKYIKKGTEIITEGDPSDHAYILESGAAEVSKFTGNGGKKVLGVLKEKDIFGELGLIDGLPRSTTVTALNDCVVTVPVFLFFFRANRLIYECQIFRHIVSVDLLRMHRAW